MMSEGSGMETPDSELTRVTDYGNGDALATGVYVLDAEAIAHPHRQHRMIVAQIRHKLHDTSVSLNRHDAAPVAKRHHRTRLGKKESL
jgi:hypothetical protein